MRNFVDPCEHICYILLWNNKSLITVYSDKISLSTLDSHFRQFKTLPTHLRFKKFNRLISKVLFTPVILDHLCFSY